MTIPKIIITMDGGLIQSIIADHQVDVIVLVVDTEGEDLDDRIVPINKHPTWVCNWGTIMPGDPGFDGLLAQIKAAGFVA